MPNFKHTKYGLISGLILLIPVLPFITFLPLLGLAWALGEHYSDCETGYRIMYFSALALAVIIDIPYILNAIRKDIKWVRLGSSFCFNLLLFSLVNAFTFIAVFGTHLACHGDGQTILGIFYSGPISSLVIFLNGFLIDLIKHWLEAKEETHFEE